MNATAPPNLTRQSPVPPPTNPSTAPSNSEPKETHAPDTLHIPVPDLGGAFSADFLQAGATPLREKSTHVLHLTEENKKLEDELRRMNERLQAAEQKSKALKNATTA